jgi:hypothetical protein
MNSIWKGDSALKEMAYGKDIIEGGAVHVGQEVGAPKTEPMQRLVQLGKYPYHPSAQARHVDKKE